MLGFHGPVGVALAALVWRADGGSRHCAGGLAGLIWTRRQPAALFCAGVWIYMLLIHLPLWVEYRYWQPAVPFLVSAALGAYNVTRLANRRSTRKFVV